MATLSATEQLRRESAGSARDRSARANSVALHFGAWSGAAVRGPRDERVSKLSWRRCCRWQAASAGSVKSFRASMKKLCRSLPEDIRLTTDAPSCGSASGPARSTARVAPGSHLSDFGGCERRIGGQHRDGRIGVCLRRAESWKHLVSHQSPCRSCLSRILKARACTAVFISCGCFRDCLCSARRCVHLCWVALRRDAAHVPTPSDCAWRTHCPGAVVGAAVHNPGTAESTARESH